MADGATEKTESSGNALNIRQVLSSAGPVVKCVLLRHMSASGKDLKPHFADNHSITDNGDSKHGTSSSKRQQIIPELVDEIDLDTTPSKAMVRQVLGGAFAFVGQYADEGIIIIARKEIPEAEELTDCSIRELQALCREQDIDTSGLLEKSEIVAALVQAQLPVNPHKLQPPFDKEAIRGDILLMRIAETEEELDNDDDADAEAVNADGQHDADGEVKESNDTDAAAGNTVEAGDTDAADNDDDNDDDEANLEALMMSNIKVLSNEEFFLSYTKKEWIDFASRTDVVAPEITHVGGVNNDDDSEEHNEEEEDDDEGEDFLPDEEDEEEGKRTMLHGILSEVIKRFREENGRGPDTDELLELRAQVAQQLGVEIPPITEVKSPESSKKRAASDNAGAAAADDEHHHHSNKKVKFDPEFVAAAEERAAELNDGGNRSDDSDGIVQTSAGEDSAEAPPASRDS